MPFAPGNKHGKGRPRIRDSFAAAIREKWPNDELLKLAAEFLADEDRTVAFKTWQLLVAYVAGRPTEHVEVKPELSEEEMREEIDIMLKEHIRSLPPDERARLLEDPAPTDTIQ